MLGPIISLLRPQQWLKNTFVFLPMFFSGNLTDPYCWWQSMVAFVSFCLAASSIYCLNDIKDVEADRLHPRKCRRPVASGRVSVAQAYLLTAVLMVASVAVALCCGGSRGGAMAGLAALYIALNIAYCLRLKQYAIIDVFIISLGFVIRVLDGGMGCGIWLSPWIVCMTFLLALFLAFAKRRDDVIIYLSEGTVTRPSTKRYNLAFLNQILGIIASVTIVCYQMYAISSEVCARMGSDYVYVTVIFVLAGIIRYMQVAIVDERSGSPTKILARDRFIQGCIVGWLLAFMIILYL